MQLSPIVSQTLDVVRKSAENDQAIATALMAKQQSVAKQQGEAIVELIQSIPTAPSRGIDVKA
ncbi:hypothetical protein VN12_18295 [Pirellula sp. SH-Sr6A]|jgi:hypothetical protein|uniref:hypothetical protein n=1 Tax=Pirellula sp. SH-Sr6A TaxID=1632865 RepID=UPI00078C5A10|nr:hypothetical protein [Pirellula sp. SH-Sr6A]AMV34087.1 hypothetical protein VN12_18295 [Pirellula sp. SH-Sr6A]MCU0715177.1 hypothetical protein [Pirellula sp.]